MRTSRWKKLAVATTAALVFSGASGFAQSGSTDESKRKVKTKTAPLYPDLAKRMNVAGKVKIEVVITPEGRVKSTRVVGGHPSGTVGGMLRHRGGRGQASQHDQQAARKQCACA